MHQESTTTPSATSKEQTYWRNATRKLKVGVAFATALLLLYNILLFIPIHSSAAESHLTTQTLLIVMIYVLATLALAYLCFRNYTRGLSRFAVIFDGGGKRSLFLIRWGFMLTLAGIILQLFIFFILHPNTESITFPRILLGNGLLLVGCGVNIAGFLALATSKNMPDASRRGALNMSWTAIILLAGATLLSVAIQGTLALKILTIFINLFGTYFFYHSWHQILNPKQEEESTSTESVSQDTESEE